MSASAPPSRNPIAPAPLAPDWIAADWGTSRLRVWAMAGETVLAEAASGAGMGGLSRDGFEPALLALVAPWLAPGVPVVACGMVGSRQGWVEAAYRAVPCTPLAGPLARPPAADARLSVHIVPGLRQDRPADVMRGEETQIAGFLARHPGWDGAICLPGTHSKWAEVSAGEVTSFRSFLTGELFDLLSTRSVLRHGLAGWDEAGFAEGLDEGFARPERLTGRLFGLRAEGLLAGLAPERARARLSGLLIGAELAQARPWWLGRRVAVVGAGAVAAAYGAALARLSVPAVLADGAAMTRAGLAAACALLPEEVPCRR